MKKINCNFIAQCITVLLVHYVISWNGLQIMATNSGWKCTEERKCTEEPPPKNSTEYCAHQEHLEIDSVVELKSYSTNLCDNLISNKESVSSSSPLNGSMICGTRQRPDLIFNHTSKSVQPTDGMGWRFSNDRPSRCNRTLLNYFYVVYYCTESKIINHIPQNEIAINENISVQVNVMEKIYISNTPAVVEAFESKRNPIWNRLKNDRSLFTKANKHYCEATVDNGTTILLSTSGTLLESSKSMEDGIFRNNSVEIFRKNSSPMWKYHQNVMKNQAKKLSESFNFHCLMESDEERVVFAVPIRVLTGKMKITCGNEIPSIPVMIPKSADITTKIRPSVNIGLTKTPPKNAGQGVDKGQLAGAIIGALLAFAVITVVLLLFLRYRRSKDKRTLEISTIEITGDNSGLNIQDLQNAAAIPLNSKVSSLDNKIPPQSYSPKQYTNVNGVRRKISTYSMREENIYCDLDDFHINDERRDSVGPLMGERDSVNGKDHRKRKSATLMLNNDIYSVDNEAQVNLVENGRSYHQSGTRNKTFNWIHGNRTSVVKMVDNEMYSSSDDDNDSVNTRLGNKELKHLPAQSVEKQISLKLPVKRILSKVDEQSESSSLEDDDQCDLNSSQKEKSNIENPYEVSVNSIGNIEYKQNNDYAFPKSNNSNKNGDNNKYYEPLKDKGKYFYKNSKISSFPSCHSISSVDDWIESGSDNSDGNIDEFDGHENPYEIPENLSGNNPVSQNKNETGEKPLDFPNTSGNKNKTNNNNELQITPGENDSTVDDQSETVENPYEVAIKVKVGLTKNMSKNNEHRKCYPQSDKTENLYEIPANTCVNYIKAEEKVVSLPVAVIKPRHQNNSNSESSFSANGSENISNSDKIMESDVGETADEQNPHLLGTDKRLDYYDADTSGSSGNCNELHKSTVPGGKHRKRRKKKPKANDSKGPNTYSHATEDKTRQSPNTAEAKRTVYSNCEKTNSKSLIESDDPYLISCECAKQLQSKPNYANEPIKLPTNLTDQKPIAQKQLSSSGEDEIDGTPCNQNSIKSEDEITKLSCDTIKKSKTISNDKIKLPVNVNSSSSSDHEQSYSGAETGEKHSITESEQEKNPYQISRNKEKHQTIPVEAVLNIKLPTPINNKTSSENSCSEISGDGAENSKGNNIHNKINGANENPYEISSDKRPSIVTMVSNEVYCGSSSSNEISDQVEYTDAKRPSITVMVQNEAYVSSSSDENQESKNKPTIPALTPRQYQKNPNKRKSFTVKSDNYINTNLMDNKGRKVRYRRDYEVIKENVTSSEDELAVTKL